MLNDSPDRGFRFTLRFLLSLVAFIAFVTANARNYWLNHDWQVYLLWNGSRWQKWDVPVWYQVGWSVERGALWPTLIALVACVGYYMVLSSRRRS